LRKIGPLRACHEGNELIAAHTSLSAGHAPDLHFFPRHIQYVSLPVNHLISRTVLATETQTFMQGKNEFHKVPQVFF